MKDEKKRRFRLRNGMIVEGLEKDFPWFDVVGDYQDPKVDEYFFPDGEEICLVYNGDIHELPKGGAFGPEYDIVEELFDSMGS